MHNLEDCINQALKIFEFEPQKQIINKMVCIYRGVIMTHNDDFLSILKDFKSKKKYSPKKLMTQSGPIVQNVVSFAKMNMENPQLDLKLIAEKVQNSRYNKKRFPAVILRKTDPKSTILVFKSGKMIIIGSESQKDAEKVARKTVRDISKALSIKAKISDFRVTNIVANAQIGWPIDIIRISNQKEGVKDDSFPGVVYRGISEVKAALIFSSGKVVFTGATERSSIQTAFTQLKKRLEKFKKKI